MLTSGVVLSGRYRLDERIATGGMGDVWRGVDLVLDRPVAVKVLLPALVSDPDFIARFRSEARIMAALRHPGVVQVFDCGADELPTGDQANYLIMEFVTGEPLTRRIEAAGRLDVVETMSIVEQAAQALETVHRHGVVHRDIKPSNLVVQENGTVVLVDFGVARSTNVTSITNTDAVPGTALYMAPEQAAGRPVSGATDIYALGAVAYCCLSGSPPFTGESPLQVAVAHLDEDPPELPHDIPEAVRALVRRALAKNPEGRFSSGSAMAAAARAAVSDPTAATTPVNPVGSAALRTAEPTTLTDNLVVDAYRPARRGALVGVVATVVVAIAGLATVAGIGAAEGNRTSETPPSAPTATADDGEPPPPTATTSSAPQRPHQPNGSTTKPPQVPIPTPTASVSASASASVSVSASASASMSSSADASPSPSEQPTSATPEPSPSETASPPPSDDPTTMSPSPTATPGQ
ncbi:serine/threonine-protein kinase [Salinispora oceanensis]|uniref:serine/threonine-protein kinase n=1 Tax=Salinispora oceanensis TaxID=1050199 RepID=UPI0003A89F0B|nr:serine/threonine-protein kinase [Salinispora oceanensis]